MYGGKNSASARGKKRPCNTSGWPNASFHKASGLWHAKCQVDGQIYSAGYHKSAELASMAAEAKRREVLAS